MLRVDFFLSHLCLPSVWYCLPLQEWSNLKAQVNQDCQVPLGHALGPALVQGNRWCWEVPAATQLTLKFNRRTVPFKLQWSHHLHLIFLRALSSISPHPCLPKTIKMGQIQCVRGLCNLRRQEMWVVTPYWKLPTRPAFKRRIRWSRSAGQPFLTTDRLSLLPLCSSPTADASASVTDH